MVAEAFGSGREIVIGLVVLHVVGNDLVDLVVVGIREEYRLEVGLLKLDVLHAVLLFLDAGQLVFLDLARPVVLIVAAHGQTVLGTAIHRLGINIIVLFAILHQPLVVAPLLEVLDRFLIHLSSCSSAIGSKSISGLMCGAASAR